MKQYKITSADFLGNVSDSVVPDAILSPDDPIFVNTVAPNNIVKHLQTVVTQKTNETNTTDK